MKSLLVVLCLVVAISATQNSVDLSNVRPLPLLRNPQPRIAGGQEAKPGQFPYQLRIHTIYPNNDDLFCGGSLISPQYVLTSAHCADGAKSYTVILGAHNVSDDKEPGQVRIEANSYVTHPKWDKWVLNDDIALIKLPNRVELSARVQTIRLPRKSQEKSTFLNAEGTVAGWGLSRSPAGYSPVLLFTKSKIVDNSDCRRTVSNLMRRTNLCLSGDYGRGTCNGDHGSALTIVDKDNKLTQVGLYSFGDEFGCGAGFGNVYTRLTSYLDWIEANSDVNLSS